MDKFAVNYNNLEGDLEVKPTVYKLSDVQHRLTKVAFGVVKFNDEDDDISGLWEVQQADDGEYIVAMYDKESVTDTVQEKTSSWKALVSSDSDIHLFYKKTPVTKIAIASMGLKPEDASSVAKHLPNDLEGNKKLVASMLSSLTKESRKELLANHPELQD